MSTGLGQLQRRAVALARFDRLPMLGRLTTRRFFGPAGMKSILLGAIGVMAVSLFLLGCARGTPTTQQPSEHRVVYHVVVRRVLAAPSAKVIAAVKRAVDATRLEMISQSTTNIDALFHVQSALQKEFKIEIEAVTHHKTRIDISALDKADGGLAQILFDRISSNL